MTDEDDAAPQNDTANEDDAEHFRELWIICENKIGRLEAENAKLREAERRLLERMREAIGERGSSEGPELFIAVLRHYRATEFKWSSMHEANDVIALNEALHCFLDSFARETGL